MIFATFKPILGGLFDQRHFTRGWTKMSPIRLLNQKLWKQQFDIRVGIHQNFLEKLVLS